MYLAKISGCCLSQGHQSDLSATHMRSWGVHPDFLMSRGGVEVKFGQITPRARRASRLNPRLEDEDALRSSCELCNARWIHLLLSQSEVSGSAHGFGPCDFLYSAISCPALFLISNEEQIADRRHHGLFIRGPFCFTERRQPTLYPIHAFEGKQRLQRTPPQPQRLQVHHQPQPKQPERFPQLLSGSSYHGSVGASSSTQVASTSQNQTVPGFSGELYSEDQPDLKSLHQRSPLAEHATIETQGAVPERKKAKRPPVAKEPRRPTTEDEGASPSTGTKPSIRKKPSNKVTVACDFCRGE